MEDNKIIAIVGTGYWGKNLIRNFHKIDALKLICDKNETLLNEFKKQYDDIDICLAYSDVLKNDNIKGIVLSTPAETHYQLAKEALLADKHVFVEKPLALYEEEGEDLIALSYERNKILMVGHLLQYHPVFIELKRLANSGELGKINYIYSNRLNLGKIRREENILWSFAPHDISMILSLTGEYPQKVYATGGNYLHQNIADVTTTHLDFPSGLKAHIFVSWLHPFKEQKLVVVGDKKMAVFDDTREWKDKLLLYAHKIRWENHIPIATKAEAERVNIPQNEPLKLECKHFLECISNGKRPITDGREALSVLKVLNESQRSLDDRIFRINNKQKADSEKKEFFVHDTSEIDQEVEIGKGTKIWHFSHLLRGTRIGENCNLGQNVVVGPDVTIGKGCKIQNNVSIYKGVTLDDYVFCGPSMVFTNIYNPRSEINKMDQVKKTKVGIGTTIGANATIVCGVSLGKYCFIGAGSVVVNDIPDHAMVAGNIAKQIGWACVCGEKLSDNFICNSCERAFEKSEYGLILKNEEC